MTWNERAKAVFAQGCLTYSKRADQYIEGVYPTHTEGWNGDQLCTFLAAGVEYTDFVCGLGSNLIDIRNNFSIPSTLEVAVAERVKALFPCIDKLKIVKTGSAACSAAIRIARAYTRKPSVFGTGYHGSDNVFIAAEKPGSGCVDESYTKLDNLQDLIKSLRLFAPAAVIVEPVQLDLNVRSQLEEIRSLCTEKGVVLIFDEVITGFRFPKYCTANYFDIQPDLICLGKGLGNGHPIAIVGGKDAIMETPGYFISNTHNGEVCALEAAYNTLNFLTEAKLRDLWERGDYLNTQFNKLCPEVQMVGYPTRAEIQGDELTKALFMQEMCKRGYFFGRARFLTFAHTYHVIGETLQACREVFQAIAAGAVTLEGQLPRPVFRRNP